LSLGLSKAHSSQSLMILLINLASAARLDLVTLRRFQNVSSIKV
jgi:hypothetical protein